MNKKILIAVLVATLQVNTMAASNMSISSNSVAHTEPIVREIGEQTISIDLDGGGIFLNGSRVNGGKCLIKDDISYVPLKLVVSNIYGGTLSYSNGYVEAHIEGLNFKFKLGEKMGKKEDEALFISNALIMENGTIYCPVKSLPALFNMKMSYLADKKKIILVAPDRYVPLVISSFAEFDFDADSYIQGQKVSATDKSYDVLGYTITSKQWMLNGDKDKIGNDLGTLFEKVDPGIYNVSLRVKNTTGVWSDWTTKVISIIKNAKPEVTEIKGNNDGYAQGEKITLDYTYNNEEWEDIIEERWYYKRVDEDEKNKVYTKPEYIFYKGEYEVGLQLKDSYGNWSDVYKWTMHITDEVKDTELNFKFNKNEAGTIIDNYEKRNYRDFEQVQPVQTGSIDGTYILSDSPENVSKNGILYEDYIEGKGRINFHHLNNYSSNAKHKKIAVMAENVTNKPITITLMDKIIKGPSTDALYVGQLLLYQYFKGNGYTYYTLKPGEKMLLIDTENKNWDKDMLIAGQMDLQTSGKVKFTVAAMDKGMTTFNIPYLQYLPTDNHPRGTFNTTDLFYEVTAAAGKETYFVLGNGSEEWCTGTDGITKKPAANLGNYGVVYHITITAEEDMGILLNPRGGAFRGAVRINGKLTYMIPRTEYLSGDNTKAAVIARVNKGNKIEIEYSLPNSSSSPILFGMIPKSKW